MCDTTKLNWAASFQRSSLSPIIVNCVISERRSHLIRYMVVASFEWHSPLLWLRAVRSGATRKAIKTHIWMNKNCLQNNNNYKKSIKQQRRSMREQTASIKRWKGKSLLYDTFLYRYEVFIIVRTMRADESCVWH